MRLPEVGQSGAISWTPRLTGRGLLLQVTVILGASQDVIPQLKEKYDVDTLDMVFIDHWKDRYLPDTLLLEVSLCQPPRSGPAEGGWGAVGWPVCSRDTGVGAWAGAGGPQGAPLDGLHLWKAADAALGSGHVSCSVVSGCDLWTVLTRLLCP